MVAELCSKTAKPKEIQITAYEIDPHLCSYINETFRLCAAECERAGIRFNGELFEGDFVEYAAQASSGELFGRDPQRRFTCSILNPPYRKINGVSKEALLFRKLGIETSNLYTGFLAVAMRLLEPGGELAAITPRSFCNGSYFRKFRQFFLREMELRHLHVFESRHQAFRDDEVLQENVLFHALKKAPDEPKKAWKVTIHSSDGPNDELPLAREIAYEEVVRPRDPQWFIHIAPDALGEEVVQRITAFQDTLDDLRLTISTGRVVDFRVKDFLREKPDPSTAPLIWPGHFEQGYIAWPKGTCKKPQAIVAAEEVRNQLYRMSTTC